MPVSFDKLRLADAAKPVVDQLLARAKTASDKAKIKTMLTEAAGGGDGNRILSAAEAQRIADAFQTAQMGTGQLTPQALGIGLEKSSEAVKSMASLSNLDGVSSVFTLQGQSVEARMIAELNKSIARANGRPMDINMMIFEFQSDAIEKAIVDAAKNNPNVNFRIIGDSGQAGDGGGNALPSILKQRLPNIQVKYKKDFPYAYNAQARSPKYNHGSTQGLNHHKGFATFIDGRPDAMVTGSFNWSSTADTKNYEDLTMMEGVDSSTRGAIVSYGDEFAGFWNNNNATLSPNNFANFRNQKWNEMLVANNQRPITRATLPDDSLPAYQPKRDDSVDLNGFREQDSKGLSTLFGSVTAKAILAERKKHGRFSDLNDLKERVPQLANVPAATLEKVILGNGRVSINNGSVAELDAVGFTKKQAEAIVKWREQNGDFENLADVVTKCGVPQRTLNTIADLLTADDVEVFFNSRPFDAPAGGTGYGPSGSRQTTWLDDSGTVSRGKASVVVGANDLFNRAKAGDPIDVAMYGMSVGAPEYNSLIAAAKRGAIVRIVLNDDFNTPVVNAVKALQAQGVSIDVRVQKAKTMHEKFGVVNDDVFFGSANFSSSSSTKHSEDRFTIKNNRQTADEFKGRFTELWAKSKVV